MTIVTAETWTWSPEVLAWARAAQVEAYLDPLMEATRDLFPAAQAIRVYVHQDPELANVESLVFEVEQRLESLDGYGDLTRQWIRAFSRVCPGPVVVHFVQLLIPVAG